MAIQPAEQTARQELADVTGRIDELSEQIESLDERLLSCATFEGGRMIRSRRDAADERGWLEDRLPTLQEAAKAEEWQAQRGELNARWAPLAERQIAATRDFENVVYQLIEKIGPMLSIHDEQRKLLYEFRNLDKLLPNSGRQDPRGIASRANALNLRPRPQLAWLRSMLQQHLPDISNLPPAELMPGSSPEFRLEIL